MSEMQMCLRHVDEVTRCMDKDRDALMTCEQGWDVWSRAGTCVRGPGGMDACMCRCVHIVAAYMWACLKVCVNRGETTLDPR